MNNHTKIHSALRTALLSGFFLLLAACGGSGGAAVHGIDDGSLLDVSEAGASSTNFNLWYLIDTLPHEHLSDTEIAALAYMREEEKLAHDVYLSLYATWGKRIFENIAASEQTHADAVLRLLQKYDLADPASHGFPGVFSDPTLQGLYDSLESLGNTTLIDAYVVGATIEDLDIYDLRQALLQVDNEDITVVFESLERGSRNHMRSFSARLADRGVAYTPAYISQEDYDSIINSPMEAG